MQKIRFYSLNTGAVAYIPADVNQKKTGRTAENFRNTDLATTYEF